MNAKSTELAKKLSTASIRKSWDVYTAFDWPESLPDDMWYMSPELISLYGTPYFDNLTEAQKKKLSFTEVCNFSSLVLQGERPLVQGLVHRLYLKKTNKDVTDYLHHFIDEENKHMIMFGMFLNNCLCKVYPEKKIALTREYVKGEEESAFFCKVFVVEEIGDYYNLAMRHDDRIYPLVQELSKVHHADETRHLAFGRQYLPEIFKEYSEKWPAKTLADFRDWFVSYLKSSWGDYYNPMMCKDAELEDGYELRQRAMKNCVELPQKASQKLVDLFLNTGILQEAPEV